MFVTFIIIILPFENLCFSTKSWTIEILVLKSWIFDTDTDRFIVEYGYFRTPQCTPIQTTLINIKVIQTFTDNMHNLDHSGNAEGFGGKSDVYRQSDFLRQFSSQIKSRGKIMTIDQASTKEKS